MLTLFYNSGTDVELGANQVVFQKIMMSCTTISTMDITAYLTALALLKLSLVKVLEVLFQLRSTLAGFH